ncbi:hypothetical protein DE146DRAFT_254723 [Phaeosphaeria sp. MPI-PUGE-AT-0046c]|nr:hypothetical protein DE146DRAFT_254723 [Phaeosphaeria sp. MPI-PUGE-AT-0046c]
MVHFSIPVFVLGRALQILLLTTSYGPEPPNTWFCEREGTRYLPRTPPPWISNSTPRYHSFELTITKRERDCVITAGNHLSITSHR